MKRYDFDNSNGFTTMEERERGGYVRYDDPELARLRAIEAAAIVNCERACRAEREQAGLFVATEAA